MRAWVSSIWLLFLLGLCAALPLGCSDDGDDGSGGSGGVEVPTCESNLDCEPGLACVDSICDLCGSDGHCLREERCDPASNRCVFRAGWGNECVEHEQCPLGRFCSQGLCLATELVTPCGVNGQCPEGMRCNNRVGNPPLCEEDLGCAGNDDCGEGEICNPGTLRCERGCTPENQDEVCATLEICVDGRCVGCVKDDDCAPGLTCDVEAGICVGEGTCFHDRDCPTGQVCNPRISFCTEPPPPCTSDNECLRDERCDLRSGRCRLRACVPDLDAPNGTQEEATTLSPGVRPNLMVCENEEKWYRIPLDEGDRISIVIDADVLAIHGFEAQLRTEEGQVLDASPNHLLVTIDRPGDYFLRIRTKGERVPYALTVLISKGRVCRNDTHEPNDEVEKATPVEGFSLPALVICPGDVDWYEVSVPEGQGLVATLLQEDVKNLEIELYDGDGETRLDRNDSTGTEKKVEAPKIQGGRAFIKVEASDSRTENAYGLQFSRP